MEPEECQFCSDELSRCDCEFELAIEGLASVYGCGCDGLCFQHAAAAIDEEGETEGAAVETQGTGVTWLLHGQNPGLAALSWALVHPRASPWPSLGIWPIRWRSSRWH